MAVSGQVCSWGRLCSPVSTPPLHRPRALPSPGPCRPRRLPPAAVWPRTCQAHCHTCSLCHRTPPTDKFNVSNFFHVKSRVKIIDPNTCSPAARGEGGPRYWQSQRPCWGLPATPESGGVPACSAQALHVLRYCAVLGWVSRTLEPGRVGASRAIRTWPQAPWGCFLSGGPGAWVALSALVRDGPFSPQDWARLYVMAAGAGQARGRWERDLGL